MNVKLTPDNSKHSHSASSPTLQVTDPVDFNEGGKEYRRNLLGTTSLVVLLLSACTLEPKLLGVELSKKSMWLFLGVAHVYFFIMWRLTSIVEQDGEKKFWNIRGLLRQAFAWGTKGFPGKTKAQILLIRALPIWAFLVGLVGVVYGFVYKV